MPNTIPKTTSNMIASKVKGSLEAINNLSRQLLSQLDSQIENTDFDSGSNTDSSETTDNNDNLLNADSSTKVDGSTSKLPLSDNTSTIEQQKQFTDEQLQSLVTKRMSLIEQLFKLYTQDQLSSQLPLINEMVTLDEQLIVKSQQHKQTLSARMLKIKQSKKVTKLYKKY